MFDRKDDLTKELEQYYADREDHSSHSVLQEIQEAESYKSRSYGRNRNYDISPKASGKGKLTAIIALVLSAVILVAAVIMKGLIHSTVVTPPRQAEAPAEPRTRTEISEEYFYFDEYRYGDGDVYISDFMSALLSSDMSDDIKNRMFSDEFSIIYTEVKDGTLYMHSTIYLDDYEETYQGEAAERLMAIQKIMASMDCRTSVDVFYNEFLFTFDTEEMSDGHLAYTREDFETMLYN